MSCKPFSLDLGTDQSDLPHYQPPPCQVACPIGTDVASYIGLIWEGDLAGALEAITATNPFSGVCGRVCDAPCEPACRRTGADGPVAIRALKRYVMDRLGPDFRLPPVFPDKDRRVAIVGAGPAGLTAAQDIAASGYRVDVYEALSRPGGMMAWGIPDFRLPAEVVQQDVASILLRCPGITLHLSAPLGEAVTLDGLTRSHDAVLLTVGASAGRRLGVPGDDLPVVQDGVTFLNAVNGGARPRLPAHVIVVGGGDVAMDACRAARRLEGVEKVTVLYRRGPDEIPARQHEISAALAEGIEIVYNVMPSAVAARADGTGVLRCLRTELGASGPDGRRAFRALPGSDFDIAVGLVIAAVGQKTATLELARHGLLEGERIATDPATMRTRLDRVFAAGDAAFGTSTIVQSMFLGRKAAYYVLAALEGEAHPLPYRTPYRTRAVPVAQDPQWETLSLQHPHFLGLGDAPWAETEQGYDEQAAHEQAARCYRCDAETGSADYTVKLRETIFSLARLDATTADIARLTRGRLAGRPDPFPPTRPATFDELVFLPANLTRLVIDPYREACRTHTILGAGLELAHPMLVGGFDTAPEAVRAAVADALARSGGAYVGRRPLEDSRVPWLQLAGSAGESDARAAGVMLAGGALASPALPQRRHPGQLLGLVATAATLAQAVPFALEAKADLLVLDGSGHMEASWAELAGPPDLALMTRAVSLMRTHNAEEAFPLLWFGGLRSGTDLAKAMALGCNAGIAALAAALAMGGGIGEDGPHFPRADRASCGDALAAFLQAAVSECSMMARCTGKTDVHNLEPEDLRTTSLAAQRATGIVMAGMRL